MRNLIVVGFRGRHRAAEVLAELLDMSHDWVLDVDDAVAAYRTNDGRLRIDRTVEMTPKQEGTAGGLLGALLAGLVVAPFTAGASAAAAAAAISGSALAGAALGGAAGAADAQEWKKRYGITDEYVKQVGAMIPPGDSAVFALITADDPRGIAERFPGYGGTLLETNLPPVTAARVAETISER